MADDKPEEQPPAFAEPVVPLVVRTPDGKLTAEALEQNRRKAEQEAKDGPDF